MWQEIIALTIVAMAIGYTVYSVVKSLTAPKKKGCDTVCGGCSVKRELKLPLDFELDRRGQNIKFIESRLKKY